MQLSFRLPPHAVEKIDSMARSRGTTRTTVIQGWITGALAAPECRYPVSFPVHGDVGRVKELGDILNSVLHRIHSGQTGFQGALLQAVIDSVESVASLVPSGGRGRHVADLEGFTVMTKVTVSMELAQVVRLAAQSCGVSVSAWLRDCVYFGLGWGHLRVSADRTEVLRVLARQTSLYVQAQLVGVPLVVEQATKGLEILADIVEEIGA